MEINLILKSVSDYLFPPKRIQQMMTFQPPNLQVGCGLYNAGNSCYLNSVLQCLCFTLPFLNYLQTKDHSSKCNLVYFFFHLIQFISDAGKKSQTEFCILCEFEHHLQLVLDSQNEIILPRSFLLNLASNISSFKLQMNHKFLCEKEIGDFMFLRQEDAHDFLYSVLGLAHQSFLSSLGV